jgi:hypothetical protein
MEDTQSARRSSGRGRQAGEEDVSTPRPEVHSSDGSKSMLSSPCRLDPAAASTIVFPMFPDLVRTA